jgi:Kef-type K+ transport system membrane component KefB
MYLGTLVPVLALAEIESRSSVFTLGQYFRSNLDTPLGRLLIQLMIVLVACNLLGKVLARSGIPAVVGQVLAGILLGPSLFGLLAPDWFGFVFQTQSLGTLQVLGQLGICFFMFTVGMELNIGYVRAKAATALAVSCTSIVLPFMLGVLLAFFLFSGMAGPRASLLGFALFMGISMSITALPVLARILQERHLARTALGATALTCAAVGDVTAWIIMSFVVAIVNATSLAASGFTLLLALAFSAFMLFVVRPALPNWMGRERLQRAEPSSATLTGVVCGVLGACVFTDMIGIHALFGAFIAGVVMPDSSEFRLRITHLVEKFSSVVFLPLFFAFTGLRTEIGLLDGAEDWLICLGIIALATVGKLGGSAISAHLTGMSWRESLQLGALMNSRGLMELIALSIGYELGILSPRIFTMLVIMAVVTTMMTGPLLTLFGVPRPTIDADRAPFRA